MKKGIELTEGVTCAALNDTGTLERLIQICQLIHTRGAHTNPPCISFKIDRLNLKSLNGWLSQPGSNQNTIKKKNTTIFLKKLVVTYPQTFYNVSVKYSCSQNILNFKLPPTKLTRPFKASLCHVFESWKDHIAPDTTIFDDMTLMSEWSTSLKQINHDLENTFKEIITNMFEDPNSQSLPH